MLQQQRGITHHQIISRKRYGRFGNASFASRSIASTPQSRTARYLHRAL